MECLTADKPSSEIIHCYDWKLLTDEQYPRLIREFLDWGISRFTFTDYLMRRCLKENGFTDFLRNLTKNFNIEFISMHAPYGRDFDLNVPDVERREQMWKEHEIAMQTAVEFGSKTYTIHVGAYHYCCDHFPLDKSRDLANEALDKLLPVAERLGIVLAVENSFEPPNSASEVLGLVAPRAAGSKYIGVCYDTGHAHIMDNCAWKKMEDYSEYLRWAWWENGIILEPNALEMLQPYVVTAHIHDNSGYADNHALPGYGTLDFTTLMPKLFGCPRMLEFQTEPCFEYGTNWSGVLPAPLGGYSVKNCVEAYRKLGF